MTFTELATAIDEATNIAEDRARDVNTAEADIAAFLVTQGTALKVLKDAVLGAQNAHVEATGFLNELYAELQGKMPTVKAVSEPHTYHNLPTSQDMKQTVLEGQRMLKTRKQ
jgi:hypothetical protein